jgi:NADH:ubiquinone oxidoreductase subunit 3 (subunit A)
VPLAVLDDWFPFLVYGFFALAIPASLIAASFILATRPKTKARFTISFYLTAMLFIVFDIEIVFLYPVALWLDALGSFALAEFGFFIAILAVAYVYVWKKGALDWRT